MLRAENLHRSFGKRTVVRDVTMQVEPGNVVGLLVGWRMELGGN